MNKKGFTVAELLVSFVIISIIVFGMMNVVFGYRVRLNDSNDEAELVQYKNNLTIDIYNDILTKKVDKVESINTRKVKIYFSDKTDKELEISDTNTNEGIKNKGIYYGNRFYKISEELPNNDNDLKKYQSILFENNAIVFTTNVVGPNTIYGIDINIVHKDLIGDYGIHLRFVKNYIDSILEGSEQDRLILLTTAIMKNPVQTRYTLTTASTLVNENGLFKSTNTNDGSPTYFFRGNVQNNYLKFANLDWRIIRINEDGTTRIILADGINNRGQYAFNVPYNPYYKMYYTNSQIKPIVDNWYQGAIGNNPEYASNVVTGNYFCEQAKAKFDNEWVSGGNATMPTFTSYTPNFKCATDGNGKGYVNSAVGLITYDELVHAGAYYNIDNFNYYLYSGQSFWTMSPAGYKPSEAITRVWRMKHSFIYASDLNVDNSILPVLNLAADALVTGTGTRTDPFVIQ